MMIYKGGNGLNPNEAVTIIGATDELEGIDSEFIWIEEKYGDQDNDWELIDQKLVEVEGIKYDQLRIKLLNGEIKEIWFDITEFYGK